MYNILKNCLSATKIRKKTCINKHLHVNGEKIIKLYKT